MSETLHGGLISLADHGPIGTEDDTATILAACDACAATGQRFLLFPPIQGGVYRAPGFLAAPKVIFVGDGVRLDVPLGLRKHIIPRNAPAPPPPPRQVIPAVHLRRLRAALRDGAANVVLTGDSMAVAMPAGQTPSNSIWVKLIARLTADNPGRAITFHNRAVGGTTWDELDAISRGAPTWYTDRSRPWLDYIRDLAPDLLFIHLTDNDGLRFNPAAMLSVLGKIAAWTPAPDVVLMTNYPFALASQPTRERVIADQNGSDYAAMFMRSYALRHGLGLVDFARRGALVRDGFDPLALPLMNDRAIAPAEPIGPVEVALPFRWPHACYDFGFTFSIVADAAGWAQLGDELRITLGNPEVADNRGNVLRVGLDRPSGRLWYRVDTTARDLGGAADRVGVARTLTDYNAGFGALVFFIKGTQLFLGSSELVIFAGHVERFGGAFHPEVSCAAGAVPKGAFQFLYFNRYPVVMSGRPVAGALYMPALTDHEMFSVRGHPQLPWSGDGVGHATTLAAEMVHEPVLAAQDFCAVDPA